LTLSSQGLNYCVALLLGGSHSHDTDPEKPRSARDAESSDDDKSVKSGVIAPCACCDDDPIQSLENLQNMGTSMAKHPNRAGKHAPNQIKKVDEEAGDDKTPKDAEDQTDPKDATDQDAGALESPEESEVDKKKAAVDEELMRMSLNTALAIGLHNFPEGLATFVATLDDPKVGGVLAVAIAIHNIPEGLCVAMPIYYATGDKWKAFWWALLSGASEPFAGLLGWIILSQSFSDTLYGVLFGMVGGMMVVISVRELLPTAHKYDPEDTVVTYSFIIGMLIMAVSLVLFLF